MFKIQLDKRMGSTAHLAFTKRVPTECHRTGLQMPKDRTAHQRTAWTDLFRLAIFAC